MFRIVMSSIMRRRRGLNSAIGGSCLRDGLQHPHPLRQEPLNKPRRSRRASGFVQSQTESTLQRFGISHRLDEIAGLVDRVTVLRDGRSMGTFAARRYRRRKVVWLITGHDAFATRLRQSAKPDETPLLVTKQLSRNEEFEDISIDVRCGEIVVITGLIGSGRTEP